MFNQNNIVELIATRPDTAVGIFLGGSIAVAVVVLPALKVLFTTLVMVFNIGMSTVLA